MTQKLVTNSGRNQGRRRPDQRQRHPARSSLWSHSWHKADAKFFPSDRRQFDDFDAADPRLHPPGTHPGGAAATADDLVVTLGSCFARELRTFLSEAGLLATQLRIPEGLNNTYALLDFVAWCVTGSETGRGFRYDRLESGEIQEWVADEERETFAGAFADAGAFVFTIGLAEVWQDRETGGVFWRGVPKEIFDADRHVFRLTTVEENARNILEMIDLVRQVNPTAPIVVTLSPVPLEATFRDISCMTADSVSKSVLRVAIDQAMGEHRAERLLLAVVRDRALGGCPRQLARVRLPRRPLPARHPLHRRPDHRRVRRGVLRAGRGRADALAADAAEVAHIAAAGRWEAIGERTQRSARAKEKRARRQPSA